MSNPPEKSVWLDIPDDCRMRGEFTGDHDIQIMFGDPNDGANVLFERPALERFARLALALLAVPDAPEPAERPVTIVAPDQVQAPDIAFGEDSAFVQELRVVSELTGTYARWVLDPNAEGELFPVGEQLLLSVRLAALGQAVRELAYSHRSPDTTSAADNTSEQAGS